MTPERAICKAECLVRGYRRFTGKTPSKHAAIMILAVANLESACGDSVGKLPLPFNWGSVQRRAPTAAEIALVKAGGKPVPKDEFEQLHIDTHPGGQVYLAWFFKFPPDWAIYPQSGLSGHDAAAWELCKVILGQEPETLSTIDTITAVQLATNMRTHGYYEGMFGKGKRYPAPSWYHGSVKGDGLVEGTVLCIASYAGGIAANAAAFESALKGWDPTSTPDPSQEDRDHAAKGVAESLQSELDEAAKNNWGAGPGEDE